MRRTSHESGTFVDFLTSFITHLPPALKTALDQVPVGAQVPPVGVSSHGYDVAISFGQGLSYASVSIEPTTKPGPARLYHRSDAQDEAVNVLRDFFRAFRAASSAGERLDWITGVGFRPSRAPFIALILDDGTITKAQIERSRPEAFLSEGERAAQMKDDISLVVGTLRGLESQARLAQDVPCAVRLTADRWVQFPYSSVRPNA